MSAITGLEAVSALRAKLDRLASSEFKRDVLLPALADTAREQIDYGFGRQVDPYDKPWKRSIRAATEGGQTLVDTGALQGSFVAGQTTDTSTEVVSALPYAGPNNYGATIKARNAPYLKFKVGGRWVSNKRVVLPRRLMIPSGDRPLGVRWRNAMQDAYSNCVRAVIA